MSTTFTIIIPCYNDGRYLARSVGSSMVQTGLPHIGTLTEVIVVDDGSTDDTRQICGDLVDKHGDVVRYLNKENGGVSSARNAGIDAARGEFLVFLDADDELTPHALSAYAGLIREDTRWLIGGSQWERDGRVRERSISLPPTRETRFVDYLDKKLHVGNISNMCWRKSLFDGFHFDTSLPVGEDLALFAVLFTREDPVVVPQATALAHRRKDSLRTRTGLEGYVDSVVADVIFQHPLLDSYYQKFLGRFLARRGRSIMKQAWREKHYDEVVKWYHFMIRHNPLRIVDLKMLYRYLRARTQLRMTTETR
jgi:glycosyltransferase involved in cell wall biosynthesis